VQVDAVLTVFEAQAGSAGDGNTSSADAPQGATAYEQLSADIVAAARALGSDPEGAAALELSSRLGVAVQSLPSVTVEELTLTLTRILNVTLILTLTLTLTTDPDPDLDH
jgi:hypothetical protein